MIESESHVPGENHAPTELRLTAIIVAGALARKCFPGDGCHGGWTFVLAQVAVVSGSAAVPRPAASSFLPLRQTPLNVAGMGQAVHNSWRIVNSTIEGYRGHNTHSCSGCLSRPASSPACAPQPAK
jgi:hypothetical protein